MPTPNADRLFHAYRAPLVRYLTRRLGDRDWAEAIAQEAVLRALRQIKSPLRSLRVLRRRTAGNERAWLFAIATSLARVEVRRDARRRRYLDRLAAKEPAEPAKATPAHPADSKSRDSKNQSRDRARAQEATMARSAVEHISERERLALLLREEGLTYPEIAEALKLSLSAVGLTLANARRHVTEEYEALQRDHELRTGHFAS